VSFNFHDIEEQEGGLTDADKQALLVCVCQDKGAITIPAYRLREQRPVDTRKELHWIRHAGGSITIWTE
jgi:hypothetical protein